MKYWVCLGAALLVSACGSDNETEISMDDFVNEVENSVEEDADNCGIVDAGDSKVEANTCVADAFMNDRAFYAVYWLMAFDTAEGRGLSGDGSGAVTLWHYTSNPTGGVPGTPPELNRTECLNASFSGSVDGGYDDVFLCD